MGTSAATQVAALSRSPRGVETVRKASAVLACPVEFVLLDGNRAIMIAALGPATLQPRPLVASEELLLDPGKADLIAELRREGDTTSVRVDLAIGHVVALTARAKLDSDGRERLGELAEALKESIENSPESRDDPFTEREILAGVRDLVLVLTADFTIAWCNHASLTLLGWSPGELIGRPATDLIHPDDIESALDGAQRLRSAHEMYRLRLRLKDALGQWVPVAITGLDHSDNPAIGGLVLSIRNDEREMESERALDQSRRVSSAILQNLYDAVIATDRLGTITIVNDAARELFGIPATTPAAAVAIEDIPLLYVSGEPIPATQHPVAGNGLERVEVCVAQTSGVRQVTVSHRRVSSDSDHLGVVATFHDVTQARDDARELRSRALHDQLTGLANRRYLRERLQALRSADSEDPVAACFVDIDKFKNVNDIHGHRVGDEVLRIAATRLSSALRPDDILARPGGDEFVIVLVDAHDARHAPQVAERIRAALGEPYEVDGNRLHLTASVGIAVQTRSKLDDERLLQNADIALYAAKDRGRDRVEIFDEELAETAELEQAQRNMVRETLDADRLVMMFQPIVGRDGAMIGVEALARCKNRDGAMIEPAGFLQAIDGTSLMVRLDRRAFEISVAAAAEIQRRDPDGTLWVACNFSATTLAQSDFVDVVLAAISAGGIEPRRVCVELTETAAFEAGPSSIAALARLNDAGVRIALDDFGTGYSSLSHLRDLPLSTVKIDRSFVNKLDGPGTERAIASAVKDLAHALGFGVVAEGVETAEQEQAVRDIGLDSMQGWFFAQALDLDVLLESIEKR